MSKYTYTVAVTDMLDDLRPLIDDAEHELTNASDDVARRVARARLDAYRTARDIALRIQERYDDLRQ